MKDLRKYLHQHPELSNREHGTSGHIAEFFSKLRPDETFHPGKTGIAFVFNGREKGKTTLFRAELDALPITEQGTPEYKSVYPGVSHVCGHDGHMAILAGLGREIAGKRPERGKVILLFQPAEEVEQGARDVMQDPALKSIKPDCIFALHNIPGMPMHQVIIREGSFASASRGMVIGLRGKTSHAGEPEKGINPARAIARFITALQEMNLDPDLFSDVAFSTVINIQLGEVAFGTSPGKAVIRITLRAFQNDDMNILCNRAEGLVSEIAASERLSHDITYTEIFPATVNDPSCITIISQAASDNGLSMTWLEQPFRWSEDFGYYTEKFPGGYFGLGSGESQPALHNPDFDFPDELIQTGIRMFFSIYSQINL